MFLKFGRGDLFNMELSVICPSINPHRWPSIVEQLNSSIGKYPYEVTFVGPQLDVSDKWPSNVFQLESFACPSVAFQRAAGSAKGRFLAFIPDDMSLDPLGFEKALDFMQDKPDNHGMVLRYSEGGGNQDLNPEYWRGRFHEDQRLPGIKEEWLLAPCFLYNTNHFKSLGGLDCSLEHVNLNGHSVAYKTQHNGGKMHLSPTRIFQAGWQPPTLGMVLYRAYLENDRPKFTEFWSQPNAADLYNVSFDNWKSQPQKWPRRYG